MTDEIESPVDAPTDTPDVAAPEEGAAPILVKEVAEEPISGKLGTILRREQQFQAKVKAEKGRLASERETMQRERAELDALKAKYARIKEDPIEGLRESGLSYEDLTRNILNAGTPEAKVDALQKKLESLEQQIRDEQNQVKAKSTASEIDNGKALYQKHIFDNVEQYPTLSLYDESEVREAAWQIATQYYEKTNIAPDETEVAEYLEAQALAKHKSFEERRASRLGKVADIVGESLKAKGGTKTLTNSKAAERSVPQLPPNIDKLPLDEQQRIYADYLAKNMWKN